MCAGPVWGLIHQPSYGILGTIKSLGQRSRTQHTWRTNSSW